MVLERLQLREVVLLAGHVLEHADDERGDALSELETALALLGENAGMLDPGALLGMLGEHEGFALRAPGVEVAKERRERDLLEEEVRLEEDGQTEQLDPLVGRRGR